MKIAILDADPRICGPMSWSRHLASGFTELGHEPVVVSSTKSGRTRNSWGEAKWGGHWSVFTPGLTVKDDDLVETLNSFDMIVLPEPKVPALDKESLKNHTIPVYVDALQRTKTPFIFALHGNDYDTKSAPFMPHLMMSDVWSGTIISHSARSTASNKRFSIENVVPSPLPYRLQSSITDHDRDYTATVGTTGRFMFNKGSHIPAFAAHLLQPTNTVVELWGSDSTGLGTCRTFATYEGLLDHATHYKRYGDQELKKDDPKVTEHGNTIRPYTWDVRLDTGQLVRYLGNYTDAVAVSKRLSVHVNLTGLKYSGGLVEYSTLEAIDAGTVCITPMHVSDDRIQTVKFNLDNPPGGVSTAKKNTQLLHEVADVINVSLAWVLHGDRHSVYSSVEFNRQAISQINNPATVAQTFLDGVF